MPDRRSGRLDRSRWSRAGAAAVLVAVALAAGRAAADGTSTGRVSGPVRVPAAPVPVDPGPDAAPPALVDGPPRPPQVPLPTAEGETHRSWFAAGTWWAVLPDPGSGVHRIWGLPGPHGPWIDTGTLVDERPFAQVEVAWDGQGLVVSATGNRAYRSHALRVHRFAWSAPDRRWVPAPDHPIELTAQGEPRARMAATADGSAWLVRPRGTGLEVARTAGRTARWSGWSPLALDDGTAAGGFDLLARGDEVVVVTRQGATDALVVTRRAGQAWTSTAVEVPGMAATGPVDAAAAGGGPLSILVPATADHGAAGPQAPALLLVVVPAGADPDLRPVVSVVARAADGLSRPSLLVDGDRARVLALAPPTGEEVLTWSERGRPAPTVLVEKDASLADPVFAPGAGRRLVTGIDGAPLARPLLPAAIPPGAGLVAVASAEGIGRWTTWADGVEPAPQPPGTAAPDAVDVLVDDTFDTLPLGRPGPTSWAPEGAGSPAAEVVDDAAFATRALRLAGGADPVATCRPIPELPAARVTVEAVVRTSAAAGTGDAHLLTVRGSGGSIASVRVSRLGLLGWTTPRGRVTIRAVRPGTALVVTVRLDLAARTAAVIVRSPGGDVLAEGSGIPWMTAGPGTVDELCVRPAPGPATAVVVDSVRVTRR